jgi:hypothetical protein
MNYPSGVFFNTSHWPAGLCWWGVSYCSRGPWWPVWRVVQHVRPTTATLYNTRTCTHALLQMSILPTMQEISYTSSTNIWPPQNLCTHIVLTYLLTELSPSWEAANCAATQELIRKIRNFNELHWYCISFSLLFQWQ